MEDVAKLAKVSRPVVYTVLNHREGRGIHVSEKTKERILRICEEIGYVIPKSARELYSGISDRIAFLAQSLCPQSARLLECLQQEAFSHGIDILPLITMGEPEVEIRYLELMLDGRVDGVIAVSETTGSIERFRKYSAPPKNLRIVYVDGCHDGLSCVRNDKRQTAELALRQFAAERRKKLIFAKVYQYSELEEDFLKLAAAAGMPAESICVGDISGNDKNVVNVVALLQRGGDAVFASNDLLGATIVSHAVMQGIRVPETMSVIGVGDLEVARYSAPSLSTVRIDFAEIARKALSLLCGQIRGEGDRQIHELVAASLIRRGTTC